LIRPKLLVNQHRKLIKEPLVEIGCQQVRIIIEEQREVLNDRGCYLKYAKKIKKEKEELSFM